MLILSVAASVLSRMTKSDLVYGLSQSSISASSCKTCPQNTFGTLTRSCFISPAPLAVRAACTARIEARSAKAYPAWRLLVLPSQLLACLAQVRRRDVARLWHADRSAADAALQDAQAPQHWRRAAGRGTFAGVGRAEKRWRYYGMHLRLKRVSGRGSGRGRGEGEGEGKGGGEGEGEGVGG
eukprot:6185399-Pleurochrysis_carterae.AAC.2